MAGAVVILEDQGGGRGEDHGLVTVAVGMPLMVASTLPAGIGVPLWVVGASTAKPSAAGSMPVAVPVLAAGARTITLRWTF